MVKKRRKGKKGNDRGSALITVVVVTAFISILVTIILYAAGMNYYMKTSDKKNKDSFYDAEKVMEGIRAELVKEAKPAFQKAYQNTLIAFAKNGADDRRLLYNQTFANTFKTNFDTNVAAAGSAEAYLKSLVPAGYDLNPTSTNPNSLTVGTPALDVHEDEGYVLVKDVTLEYFKNGYYSKIKTDFMIKIPPIDWSIDASATTGGGTDEAPKEYEMTECVIYYNWTKE